MARHAVVASAMIFVVSLVISMSFGRQTEIGRFAEGSAIFTATVFVLSFVWSEQRRLRFLLEFGFWPGNENTGASRYLHRQKVDQRLEKYQKELETLDNSLREARQGSESYIAAHSIHAKQDARSFELERRQKTENRYRATLLAQNFGYQQPETAN